MLTAGQILKSKPNQTVHSVAPETSVLEAVQTMADKRIGALLVLENGVPAGIITERDFARKFALMNRLPSQTQVREIMSSPITHVGHAESAETCLALMAERQFRHLPVIDGNQVVGLISITDLVREVPAKQQFVIEQLERYIRGDRG
ncbi:MAG: CBS domain-containing protein [Burkholderiaceae bacterium]|nr:CBS domain-containing protein [Burkholderiaceae bacterium]